MDAGMVLVMTYLIYFLITSIMASVQYSSFKIEGSKIYIIMVYKNFREYKIFRRRVIFQPGLITMVVRPVMKSINQVVFFLCFFNGAR